MITVSSPIQPPNQPDRRVIGLVVGLIAVALIVVIIVVGVLAARQLSDGFGTAADTEETATNPDAADTDEAASPDTTDTENEDAGADEAESDTDDTASNPEAITDADVEGWQGVLVQSRPLIYDVPEEWYVHTPGMILGFEDEDPDAPFGYSPTVAMSGAARYTERSGDCEYVAEPGVAGTSSAGSSGDTAAIADTLATDWAQAAYENDNGDPQLQAADPEPFTENGLDGHQVTVDVTPAEDECYPEAAEVRVVSVADEDREEVDNLIVYADTAGEEAPDSADLDVLVSSLRPQEDWEDPDG